MAGARDGFNAEQLADFEAIAKSLSGLVQSADNIGIYEAVRMGGLSQEDQIAIWSYLGSSDRAYIKKALAEIDAENKKGGK
jgi:hypothetical protein